MTSLYHEHSHKLNGHRTATGSSEEVAGKPCSDEYEVVVSEAAASESTRERNAAYRTAAVIENLERVLTTSAAAGQTKENERKVSPHNDPEGKGCFN